MAVLILKQIVIMFLLMGLGVLLFKTGLLTERGSKEIGAILLYVVTPAITLRSFDTEYTHEKMVGMFINYGFCALLFFLTILLAEVIYKKNARDEKFAAVFSNCGFVGIPLVQSVFGDGALFNLIPYLTFMTLMTWTYGIAAISGDKKMASPKKVLKNPIILSLIAGLLMFILRLRLPSLLSVTVGYIADLNTPLAMIVMGSYMVKVNWKKALTTPGVYFNASLRLLIFPLISLLTLFLFRNINREMIYVILLVSATPTAAACAIIPPQIGRDPSAGTSMVCVSTVLSVLTIPVFMAIAEYVINM